MQHAWGNIFLKNDRVESLTKLSSKVVGQMSGRYLGFYIRYFHAGATNKALCEETVDNMEYCQGRYLEIQEMLDIRFPGVRACVW